MSSIPSKRIKVLIADDHVLFCQGLRALFAKAPEIEVIGEVYDGKQAVDTAITLVPDVILLNIMMPVLDGIGALQRIKALQPQIEVIMLTALQNESYQRQSFAAGARGYLSKESTFEEVLKAVRHAARGDYYISGSLGRDLIAEYVQPLLNSQKPGGVMTQRERELARLISDGYSTKEAAEVLNISPKTAETHRAAIMKKLDARNVADIVKYCIRNHIIEI